MWQIFFTVYLQWGIRATYPVNFITRFGLIQQWQLDITEFQSVPIRHEHCYRLMSLYHLTRNFQSRVMSPFTYEFFKRFFVNHCLLHFRRLSFSPRLHDEAGSTSCCMLPGQTNSMFARCLLDFCSTFARCLVDVCLMFARWLLRVGYASCMLHICSMFARSYKRGIMFCIFVCFTQQTIFLLTYAFLFRHGQSCLR